MSPNPTESSASSASSASTSSPDSTLKMPVLFIGHGSPMNAIEDNVFTQGWHTIAPHLNGSRPGSTRPKAILMISAHWFTDGCRIMGSPHPQMIYDMYGFPRELYEIVYPAPGAPELAETILDLLTKPIAQPGDPALTPAPTPAPAAAPNARIDQSWGFDHGGWSVLVHLFPEADIPILQLSVDAHVSPASKYAIGQALRPLREQGVLIIGSGNIVHNLGRVQFDVAGGTPWAIAFDGAIQKAVTSHRFADVLNYRSLDSSRLAVPTTDHFDPLLYCLGAADEQLPVTVFNDACQYGSLSMTGYLFE